MKNNEGQLNSDFQLVTDDQQIEIKVIDIVFMNF